MFRGRPACWFYGPWQIHLDIVSIHIMQSYWTRPKARKGWVKAESWGAKGQWYKGLTSGMWAVGNGMGQ